MYHLGKAAAPLPRSRARHGLDGVLAVAQGGRVSCRSHGGVACRHTAGRRAVTRLGGLPLTRRDGALFARWGGVGTE